MRKCSLCSAVALACSLALVGCASTPSIGDRMLDHSKQVRQQGQEWSSGEKMVKRAEKDREQAAKRLAAAQESLADAETRLREGQQMMAASEQTFAKQQKPTLR